MLNVLPLFSSVPLSVNVPPVFWFSVLLLLIVSVLPLGTVSWPVLVYVPSVLLKCGVVVHVHGAAVDEVAGEDAAPVPPPTWKLSVPVLVSMSFPAVDMVKKVVWTSVPVTLIVPAFVKLVVGLQRYVSTPSTPPPAC